MKKTFTAQIRFWRKKKHWLPQSSLSWNLQTHFSVFHMRCSRYSQRPGDNQDLHSWTGIRSDCTRTWILASKVVASMFWLKYGRNTIGNRPCSNRTSFQTISRDSCQALQQGPAFFVLGFSLSDWKRPSWRWSRCCLGNGADPTQILDCDFLSGL